MQGELYWLDATIKSASDVTPSIRQFQIAPAGGPPQWTPGSHIEIGVIIDGRAHTPFYSLGGDYDPMRYPIAAKREQPIRGGPPYIWALSPDPGRKLTNPRT